MASPLQIQISGFGQIYKDVPGLYGIYIKSQAMSSDPNVTVAEFERLQLIEPLREEMMNYARKLTGQVPVYNEEIPTLERELERTQDEDAREVLERELKQARDREYESSTLIPLGFLNQYGEYDRGQYQDNKLEQYNNVLSFIREIDSAVTENDVSAVRVKFSIFKRDLLERRYNMGGKSKYVRSFREGYRSRRK